MSDQNPTRFALSGSSDLAWITFVGFTALVVTTLLVGHLRSGVELYQLGNELAYASAETRSLENQRRSLEIELQHRTESIDIWSVAEGLGLAPASPQRVVEVQ